MWEPRRLTALWASTACYRGSFTFLFISFIVDVGFETARIARCRCLITFQHTHFRCQGTEPYQCSRTRILVISAMFSVKNKTLLIIRSGSVVGWGTMLQTGRSPVRIPDEVELFNLPNPSTMALGSTQPLTEMCTRNLLGDKKKSGRRLGLTTLPPSMNRMSENVGASTSRNPKGLHGLYGDNFTLPLQYPI
jgi:hypothetical protein